MKENKDAATPEDFAFWREYVLSLSRELESRLRKNMLWMAGGGLGLSFTLAEKHGVNLTLKGVWLCYGLALFLDLYSSGSYLSITQKM